jgi:2-haloacid dehalogenase
MQTVNAVVFDLGGVLIDWNPRYLYRTFFPDDEAGMERFLEEIGFAAWNDKQDAGRPFAEAVAELTALHPHHTDKIAAFWTNWAESLGDAIDGTVSILRRLKKAGVPLYALTNWSAETFPVARQRFDFLTLFDGILVSGEEKIRKPDAAIFHLMQQRFSLEPGRTIFIDDTAKNIAAAEKLGFIVLPFTTPASLQSSLLAHGIGAAG